MVMQGQQGGKRDRYGFCSEVLLQRGGRRHRHPLKGLVCGVRGDTLCLGKAPLAVVHWLDGCVKVVRNSLSCKPSLSLSIYLFLSHTHVEYAKFESPNSKIKTF